MSKLITAVIAAGLGFGLNAATAQNVDSDKDKVQRQEQMMQDKDQGAGQSTGALRTYDQAGERQVGLEQYRMEQQQCATMSGDARRDCLHKAKVRYQGWAIMQCELVSGASREKCYQNIQAAVMGFRAPTGPAVRSTGATDNVTPESGQAVQRGEDELKPGRQ